MKINLAEYRTKSELFDYLCDNKKELISDKKAELKKADAFSSVVTGGLNKAANSNLSDSNKLKAELIINTTNVIDSHYDVHINGLWSKSLKERKDLVLLQEHVMKFDHVISDKVKAKAELIDWLSLGYNFKGKTQALKFIAEIEKDRNEYMFNQYAKGYVKNHSVGMRYVNLFLSINSDEDRYKEEKKAWDKYRPVVVNEKEVDEVGFFWAVTEAKVEEGSAVVRGSNSFTPVQYIEPKQHTEPKSHSIAEPTNHSKSILLFN